MTDPVFRSREAGEQVRALYRGLLGAWPVPHGEQVVQTGFGPTFVVECGSLEAPPVVLVHGAQANAAAWIPDVADWAKSMRIFAADMPGEPGLSGQDRHPVTVQDYADWLEETLDGLGIERASFVGNSLGGLAVSAFAATHPARVDRLVLINPGGIGRQRNFLLKALPLMLLGSWGKRRVREMVFGPRPSASGEDARPLIRLMELIGREVRPRTQRLPLLSDGQLAALDMPVLAILGGRDALIDAGHTKDRLEANARRARIALEAGGYHYLPAAGMAVKEFLTAS